MDVGSINSLGGMSSSMDKQLFGAQVVSRTLDAMNMPTGFGAQAAKDMGGMSQTYQFSQDVLGAYMSGRGTISDMNI